MGGGRLFGLRISLYMVTWVVVFSLQLLVRSTYFILLLDLVEKDCHYHAMLKTQN